MPYITYDEYTEITHDTDTPQPDIDILLDPASAIVNEIALFQIGNTLNGFNKYEQEAIKKATAYQVYEMNRNGGLAAFFNGGDAYTGHVQIGSFGYGNSQENAALNSNVTNPRMSEVAVSYISSIGLNYAGVGGCRKYQKYTWTPKPPKPEPPGGGEDMFKLCWIFYLLGNFEGGFDSTGNNLIFPGGPVRIVTADDSKIGTVAGGTLPYVHAQFFRINVDTFDISVGEWPTEPNLRACGYMHNNGPKKIIEVFGMGTQVWPTT